MKHLLLALACASALPAHAELITFEYTGVINTLREIDNTTNRSRAVVTSTVLPGLSVGSTYHGHITLDTTAPVNNIDPANHWTYYQNALQSSAAAGLTFDAASYAAYSQYSASVGVRDQAPAPGSDDYDYLTLSQWNGGGFGYALNFYDDTAGVLSSSTIPASVTLDDWYSANLSGYWSNADGSRSVLVEGMLTSLTRVSPVPEPSTYAMLFAGLAIAAGAAARKRRPHA